MRDYYICSNCGEINYDTSTELRVPFELIYYSKCKKCGKNTQLVPNRVGTEFTEEEIVNAIKYINKKMNKIRGKATHKSDLPIKKQNILTTLDVIGTFLDSALYGRFIIDCKKERSDRYEDEK